MRWTEIRLTGQAGLNEAAGLFAAGPTPGMDVDHHALGAYCSWKLSFLF
jgi:hypothetical protein